MAYSRKMTEEEKEAKEIKDKQLDEIRRYGLTLNEVNIGNWFAVNEFPSPTTFALDFDIDPKELASTAQEDPLVMRALQRIIGMAEQQLYWRVFGPKAVIQRTELFTGGSSISEEDVNGEDSEESLFKKAN